MRDLAYKTAIVTGSGRVIGKQTAIMLSKMGLNEEEQQPSHPTKEHLSIEHEIEHPRCHDVMTLQSQFDGLCYFCEELFYAFLGQ